jgi:hypothetical protein
MALDPANYPSELDITSPAFNEPVGEADDQIRTAKRALNQGFPNVAGAVTADQDELNTMDGITATTAELNIMDGVTATTAELNYVLPAGSSTVWMQAAAPTGWTKSATHNNKALRIVSGSGGGSGGSVAFTTAFSSTRATTTAAGHTHTVTVNNHTLTAAQSGLPSHKHISGVPRDLGFYGTAAPGGTVNRGTGSTNEPNSPYTSDTGGTSASSGHNHTASSGSAGGHSHTSNLAVQYVDAIICTKDAY